MIQIAAPSFPRLPTLKDTLPMKQGNILKLISLLKSLPDERFNIYNWSREDGCKTVRCIGGWACSLIKDTPVTSSEVPKGLFHQAAGWLGLSQSRAAILFYTFSINIKDTNNKHHCIYINRAFAIKLLEDLLEFDSIDHEATLRRHSTELLPEGLTLP